MRVLVIVGVGPGLGLSLAKRFGTDKFKVGLIARRQNELDEYISSLSSLGIEAAGFSADVTDERQLQEAFGGFRKKFGRIDVLIYNAAVIQPVSAVEATTEIVNKHLQVNLLGAVSSVQQVVAEMIERKEGAILFTGGGHSDLSAIPFLTPLSIGKSGLRSYAHCLHDELAGQGVYAGMFSIAGVIKEGTLFDPDRIAECYYDLYNKRETVERFYTDPDTDPIAILK
jgi:NAD(P)-dependent dehydrogenase (short-subunit alcohol dehydrogenase family)